MLAPDLSPLEIRHVVTGLLADAARHCTPEEFRAFFCGAIVANVVGNLPEDYWRKFIKIEICNEPGCDCYKIQTAVIDALIAMRDDHHKFLVAHGTNSKPADPAVPTITDTDRINWLDARPLPAEMRGGPDDGCAVKFWGISARSGTLRETLDHMIKTGSEQRKPVEKL